MSRYTVDASVAIKWFVPEAGSEAALRLLHEQLVSPDLLFPEVGNILWKKSRRKEISEDEGLAILGALSRAEIEIHPTASRRLLDVAFHIASDADITLYDSLYVSLAALDGAPLVTADRKLVRKLGRRYVEHVVWVEDVP